MLITVAAFINYKQNIERITTFYKEEETYPGQLRIPYLNIQTIVSIHSVMKKKKTTVTIAETEIK